MSKKSLITLLLLLIVAAGAAVFLKNRERTPSAGAAGEALLPSLDLAKVGKVTASFAGQTAVLERGEIGWAVATLFGYPADFPRLRQALIELTEIKTGSIVRGGMESPADFGLLTDATTVTFFDASDAPLATVSLGRSREGAPSRAGGGRYLRVGDGPVVLVKEDLRQFSVKSDEWIDKKVLEANSPLAREIKVTLPESSYTLKIAGENSFELEGLTQDEKINNGSASRLTRALQSFRCLTVADPAKSGAELGFDKASSYELKTSDGFTYTALIGGSSDAPAGRYARVSVAYVRPPPPTREEVAASLPPEEAASPSDQTGAVSGPTPSDRVEVASAERLQAFAASSAEGEKKAAELKARVEKWTFVIPAQAAETLTMPREKLLIVPEKPAPEAPGAVTEQK
jgi:hypothetical protein